MVHSNLRLSSIEKDRSTVVDLAAFDGKATPRFLYKLKYVRDADSARRRFRETVRAMVDWPDAGDAQQVLVIAVDDFSDGERQMLQGQTMNYLSGLKRPIQVAFLNAQELDTMSDDEFARRLFLVRSRESAATARDEDQHPAASY
jgi:hypothetical protein